jgi:hypothetical protein
MSSELVCQVARSWVDVGSFHARLFIIFMIFTVLVRKFLDITYLGTATKFTFGPKRWQFIALLLVYKNKHSNVIQNTKLHSSTRKY